MPRDLWQEAKDRDSARRRRQKGGKEDAAKKLYKPRGRVARENARYDAIAGGPRVSDAAPLLVMPFGKHKGKPFGEIPASYLHWLADVHDMPKPVRLAALAAIASGKP